MLDNDNEAHRLALAARLKEALDDSKIPPADLARRLNRTPQAVTGWLTTGRISKDRLAAFAKEVGEDLDYLVSGQAPAPRMPKVAKAQGRGDYKAMAELQHPTNQEAQLLKAFRALSPDRKSVIVALAMLLAACVTTPPQETFDAFQGRPLTALTQKLGGPEDRQSVAGETWLAWTYVSGMLSCRLSARVDGEAISAVRAMGHRDGCRQLAKILSQ